MGIIILTGVYFHLTSIQTSPLTCSFNKTHPPVYFKFRTRHKALQPFETHPPTQTVKHYHRFVRISNIFPTKKIGVPFMNLEARTSSNCLEGNEAAAPCVPQFDSVLAHPHTARSTGSQFAPVPALLRIQLPMVLTQRFE